MLRRFTFSITFNLISIFGIITNAYGQNKLHEDFKSYFVEIPLTEPLDIRRAIPVFDYHLIPDTILHAYVTAKELESLYLAGGYGLEGVYSFPMSDKVDGFLLRYYEVDHFLFKESHILLLLNHRTHEMIDVMVLDVQYQEEGIYGEIRSILADFNDDGVMEIVRADIDHYHVDQRDKYLYTEIDGYHVYTDTVSSDSLFNNHKSCDSTNLKNVDFTEVYSCMEDFFKLENVSGDWCIELASDTSLSRISELKNDHNGTAIFNPQTAHYVGYWRCELYQAGNTYYLVLNNGITLTQARLSLPVVHQLFTSNAKPLKLTRVCKNWERAPGFDKLDFICVD